MFLKLFWQCPTLSLHRPNTHCGMAISMADSFLKAAGIQVYVEVFQQRKKNVMKLMYNILCDVNCMFSLYL